MTHGIIETNISYYKPVDNVDKFLKVSIFNRLREVDFVENNIRKYGNTEIDNTKVKIINIKVDEEFIENNIIDMPFIYYYKTKQPIMAVKYTWFSNDGRQRAVEVRGSKYGVPSPYEYDVLLALFRILLRNHGDKLVFSEDNTCMINNTVNFTFRELAKEMGYKNFGGTIKAKLDKAIERLCDTNIYNTSFGGLYNPITKEYILDAKKQICVLQDYTAYQYVEDKDGILKLDKKSLKDKASVTFHEFFLSNLCHGKGKFSNKKLRLSLKSDVAKRMYLILNKWRNNRHEMFITYEKLYERIPLDSSKTVSYRNKRIHQACDELIKNGYLEDIDRTSRGINFIFKLSKKQLECSCDSLNDTNNNYLLDKYVSYGELLDGFKRFGLENEDIDKYFKLHQVPFAQALLRYVEIHLPKIENTKAYIIKGLKDGYKELEEDKKYYSV
ncbi:hypothetical protein CBC_A1779 [Clostridium botulinum C str. Eklund]|nr:hypothetical protein CBC_A1779 [Clostridium botulinum C str. Eklund]